MFTIISLFYSDIKNNDLYITRNFFTSFILSILGKQHILEIHDDILVEGRIMRFFIKKIKILNFKSVKKIIKDDCYKNPEVLRWQFKKNF